MFTNYARKVVKVLAPAPKQSADGRDQWNSRAAFLLAAMGGCAGQGNLLRYPSVVYNNYGLQWFIPYLIAVVCIAIPALILEVSIGQAYRGGTMVAFNGMNRRLRGVGIGPVLVSMIVTMYFITNLAWIMVYFRHSFTSPLPWENRIDDFYWDNVIRNPDPVPAGRLTGSNVEVAEYTNYSSRALLGETVGWTAFVWFLCWISIVRGVGMLGNVVYFTMIIPIITTIIFVGRACSLPNAVDGLRLLWATWRGEQLASAAVWQSAVGQVFFSTGIGFGYFTSLASFNQKHSNAVMDAILICSSNVAFENVAALAIFGVVGFLGMNPDETERLGAFVVGFLTLPEAVLQFPGANFWTVLLFFTLSVLGFSSAFVMLDVVATFVCDSGRVKVSRAVVVTSLTLILFLLSLPYCTEFGYYLLDGVDRWINNVVLIFVVWAEVVSATTVYRWQDVVAETSVLAYAVYNVGYVGGQVVGISIAHGTGRPEFGIAGGFGLFVVCTATSVLVPNGSTLSRHTLVRTLWDRLYSLAFFSGEQLRQDLNMVVAPPTARNWKIPAFWPLLLRYLSGPVLAIIFSFAYPEFYTLRYDPMMIVGFSLAHIVLFVMLLGFILPRYYGVFIPRPENLVTLQPASSDGKSSDLDQVIDMRPPVLKEAV